MKLDELATFGALMMLFVLMAYAIITTAESYEPVVSDPPKDTRPVIPDCDLPTWEEVRGSCARPRTQGSALTRKADTDDGS